ncbi:MAG: nitrogenase iron-molybdenum cofactor biosynthesis protein NifE, partial [Armatimonadetes bacterium]|nr:nitrogenase iron-molybdenum cofactor biosynthesis protein NifE [Armatimonadota bacterium]
KINAINYLGDFNLAGEAWIISNYLKQMGIDIIAKITGDSTCSNLMDAPMAKLNIVQCAGSMTYLAKEMEETYGIPFLKVSFLAMFNNSSHVLGT